MQTLGSVESFLLFICSPCQHSHCGVGLCRVTDGNASAADCTHLSSFRMPSYLASSAPALRPPFLRPFTLFMSPGYLAFNSLDLRKALLSLLCRLLIIHLKCLFSLEIMADIYFNLSLNLEDSVDRCFGWLFDYCQGSSIGL